ncbi:MAG: thiolase family protein [Planctomycetota bacterium]|nr:thiolase family protein [Planctomycetota bacterium]MDP6940739.1 thiolase family protein [Planctomycetota bacterium]
MPASPVVIVSALRTPIGRYMGGLATQSAVDLGEVAARGALNAAGLEGPEVDVLYFGHGRQAGCGPNPARQVALRAGLSDSSSAATINQACASGLKSIQLAADDIAFGRTKIALAGGMESMSRLPFILDKMRSGYRLGHSKVVDLMYQDGFLCPVSEMIMGETAELLAQERSITREEQDSFAIQSQQRAGAAIESGRMAEEITPVTISSRKGDTVANSDEHPRPGAQFEKLAKLPAVFDSEKGTVTAGNSSGITDGAAALVLMAAEEAERRGLNPLASFSASHVCGTDPKRMGMGPVPATAALMEQTGLGWDDFDLVELNEAFAAQVLACLQEMPIEQERLNVNGGSIALGHPIGMTGARFVVTLLHEMRRRNSKRGLATLCVSGGQGMSAVFERN